MMDAAEYKRLVSSRIFLKYASDTFATHRETLRGGAIPINTRGLRQRGHRLTQRCRDVKPLYPR